MIHLGTQSKQEIALKTKGSEAMQAARSERQRGYAGSMLWEVPGRQNLSVVLNLCFSIFQDLGGITDTIAQLTS